MTSNTEPRSLRDCFDGCLAFSQSLSRIRAEFARHRANAANPESDGYYAIIGRSGQVYDLASVCRRYESLLEDLVRGIVLAQSAISDPLRKQIWPAGTEPLQLFH